MTLEEFLRSSPPRTGPQAKRLVRSCTRTARWALYVVGLLCLTLVWVVVSTAAPGERLVLFAAVLVALIPFVAPVVLWIVLTTRTHRRLITEGTLLEATVDSIHHVYGGASTVAIVFSDEEGHRFRGRFSLPQSRIDFEEGEPLEIVHCSRLRKKIFATLIHKRDLWTGRYRRHKG